MYIYFLQLLLAYSQNCKNKKLSITEINDKWELYSVQCTVCSVQCTVYSVHCKLVLCTAITYKVNPPTARHDAVTIKYSVCGLNIISDIGLINNQVQKNIRGGATCFYLSYTQRYTCATKVCDHIPTRSCGSGDVSLCLALDLLNQVSRDTIACEFSRPDYSSKT